jgi:hypothetical protein
MPRFWLSGPRLLRGLDTAGGKGHGFRGGDILGITVGYNTKAQICTVDGSRLARLG